MKAKILFDNTVAEPKGATITLDTAMLPKVPTEDGDYKLLIENGVAVWTEAGQPEPPGPTPEPVPYPFNWNGIDYTFNDELNLTHTSQVQLANGDDDENSDHLGYLIFNGTKAKVYTILAGFEGGEKVLAIMAEDAPNIVYMGGQWLTESGPITTEWDKKIYFSPKADKVSEEGQYIEQQGISDVLVNNGTLVYPVNLKGAVYTTKTSGLTVTDEIAIGDVNIFDVEDTIGVIEFADKSYRVSCVAKNTSGMTFTVVAHDYEANKDLTVGLQEGEETWMYFLQGMEIPEDLTDQWDYTIVFDNDVFINMSMAEKLAQDASAFDVSLSERIYKFNDTPDVEAMFAIPSDGLPSANPVFELTLDEQALDIHALYVESQIQMLDSEGAFALGYSSTEGGWLYNNAGSPAPIGDKWDKSVVFETDVSVGFAGYKWMTENGQFTD